MQKSDPGLDLSASIEVQLLFEFPPKKTKYQKQTRILDFHVAALATIAD
jgi:hypothetical protein